MENRKIVKEGHLLKQGQYIANWRVRYFILYDDGSFVGYRQKPENQNQLKDPLNNFTIKGCHIVKVESASHFIFVVRGLNPDQNIERNFSAGNYHDRDSWCNAIVETLTKLTPPQLNNATHDQSQYLNSDPHSQQQQQHQQQQLQQQSQLPHLLQHSAKPSTHPHDHTDTSNDISMTTDLDEYGRICETNKRQPLGYVQSKKISLNDFHPIKLIGRGSWGKVMLSREKLTGSLYAIKILKKHVIISQNEVGHTLTENRVLRTTNHPFLIALKYSFRDEERLCYVMEFAGGGELFYHLSAERKFSEEKTRFYAAEIVSALGYLHDHDIIYRDLKLENLLLDRDGHVKIADFGLCKDNITFSGTTRTFCGTPEYLSPEVIEDNNYGRAVDWWSLGVLLYEMMCGNLPFNNRTTDVLFREIILKTVSFPATLSDPAEHFLNGLLTKDPAKRLGGGPDDAREIMMHAFFRGLNWQDLIAKKIAPPFIPQVSSETDTRYFDRIFTAEPVNLTPIERLPEVEPSFFNQFSYAAGSSQVPSNPI